MNLSDVTLPPFMPPYLADELASILTEPLVDTKIHYLCSLSLLYVSWSGLSVDISLGDAIHHVTALSATHTPESLIEWMASPRNFLEAFNDEQGQDANFSALLTWTATESADYWRTVLEEDGLSPAALFLQLSSLFSSIINDTSEFGSAVAFNFQNAIDLFLNGAPSNDDFDETASLEGSRSGIKIFRTRDGLLQYMRNAAAGNVAIEDLKSTDGNTTNAEPEVKPFSIQCFSPADAKALLTKTSQRPGESVERQIQLLQGMMAESGRRNMTQVADVSALDGLYTRFPHFTEVLDFIALNLALAASGSEGSPLRFPPILLRGNPGTGKSFFAEELANTLSGTFENRDLSVMTEAFVLTGHDSSWKGSKVGVVFDAIVSGGAANPIICLDELDKCSSRTNFNSPISALYSLLEPTTARRFQDEFLPIRIDASKVNWILTANSGEIPDPIIMRTEVFDIREPTQQECQIIARSVWDFILQTLLPQGHPFAKELPQNIVDVLAKMPPRVMKNALVFTAGKAALDKSYILDPNMLAIAQKKYLAKGLKKIGF